MFKWVTPAATATATSTSAAASHTFSATATKPQQHQLLSSVLTSLIIISALFVQTTSGFRSIETNGAGRKLFGGYRITPKHCRATKTLPSTDPRSNGPTICMFNHECAQRGGEVVGACMDGFLFGACCQIPQTNELASTLINDAQNAYFQQHQQQQKLQQQAAQHLPSAAAAASYENYGEQQQQLSESQSQEQKPDSYQADVYDQQQNMDKVYQQLGSSTPSVDYVSGSSSSVEQQQQSQSQQTEQDSIHFSGITEATHSSSVDLEQEAALQTDSQPASSNGIVDKTRLPGFHVHKHSVKISSPSSPPQNDDFVMQVLSTLPPEHESDIITFTTEVPTKIASSIIDRTSSESSSFEELPNDTPTPPTPAPHKPKPNSKPVQQELQKLAESMKRPVQQARPKPQQSAHSEQAVNMHHHNHLILEGGEFTHSGITHPGADADLVEDLQFSTGYGPQPVYVEPPQQHQQQQPSAEDKYVLVQTFTNEKRPGYGQNSPTTVSSITTHVDSIESIILQLNNSSHGPSYNVVSQQTPSYGYPGAAQTVAQVSYSEAATTTRPAAASPTNVPVGYQQIETKRPNDYYNGETEADLSQTTSADKEDIYDKVVDEQDASTATGAGSSSEYASPTPRPSYDEDASSGTVLDEQTMPASGYDDAAVDVAAAPLQTSQFNKMPAVGVAYPVDMAYEEEESSHMASEGEQEPAAYGQFASSSESAALASSTETSYQQLSNSYTDEPQLPAVYQRPTTNTNRPNNRPVASYIGMVTMQNYNKQPVTGDYSQLPAEVSVSSHTTKVQQDYAEPAEQQAASSYGSASFTTTSTRPSSSSTTSYISSTSAPLAQRPLYDSLTSESSSVRPVLVTASPKPRPKPRPGVKRPISSSSSIKKKTPKPQITKQPTSNYGQSEQEQPANSYNVPQQQAAPGAAYDEPQKLTQPALNYNEDGEKLASSQKPSATSYVTGPSTPRPPATVDYHYDKVPPLYMADDKLDAFIQSTAENIIGSTPGSVYQPPLYATTSTPVQVQRPTASYHKKPGFVQVHATPKPPSPTVLITPKPTAINLVTSSSWTQQPSSGGISNKIASTTSSSAFGSTSYIYSPLVTSRPSFGSGSGSTSSYVPMQPVSSNDFEDPGYFGMQSNVQSIVHPAFTQSTTEAVFALPADDKPAFPGYYGPTPTYPAFSVPGEKIGSQLAEEETFTSPNDFVNFPPVRNPNLNMSAVASSAVTSDLELSTPAFVEDIVLKDKMNTLVHKLVASLQGNFEALADMIDEANNTASSPASTYQAGAGSSGTRKTTRKPTRIATTSRPKATTKKPVTRVSTKAPNRKTSLTTRKPSTATRRTTLAPAVTTRKPSSKKPTRRVTTTSTTESSARPADDEIIDEEDEEDVNPQNNEIDQGATLSSYGGANGRKIQCGVRPHVKSGRIVGGKGSAFGAFPWQVLVRESTWLGLFTKNKCGGVLITSRYVITAAHCQPGFLASLVAVMGEFDISGDLESKRSVTKNVKRVIVHRQYDPATFENDLALLELDSPVTFDTHIVPICMPNDQADFTGRMATVTGWGRLKYGGGVPSVLQEVQVPVIENSVCQEMFHTAGHNKKILGSFLCAGYANGQKDSCEGDSGGPLVLQRPDGRYELAGTVSHGIKCAAPYLPGVYMRTTFYKPWLRSITNIK